MKNKIIFTVMYISIFINGYFTGNLIINAQRNTKQEGLSCIRVIFDIHPNDLEGYAKLVDQEGPWKFSAQPNGMYTIIVKNKTCGQ